MNYFKFNTISSFLLIILPLCILSISSLSHETLGSVINFKLIFGFVICGLLINFMHNYGYAKIINYKKTANDKYPFLYFLPSFGIIVAFSTVVILSGDNSKNEDYRTAIQQQSGNESNEKSEIVDVQDEYVLESSDYVETAEYFIPSNESEFSVSTQLTNKLKNALEGTLIDNKLDEAGKKSVENYASLFHSAAIRRDWQQFQMLANEAALQTPEALDGAVNIVLMFNGPIELITNLVNKGATISSSALLALVNHGDVDKLRELENHGLFVGDNVFKDLGMLEASLMGALKPDVFDFVLDRTNDINRRNKVLGIDALGTLLANSQLHKLHIVYYVNRMLNSGANISNQHRQIMESLKQDDVIIYELLTNEFPSLAG